MDQSDNGIEIEHSEDYQKLLDLGINETLADALDKIYISGKLTHSDLDDRALDALKDCSAKDGVKVLSEFNEKDLKNVQNKSALLCGLMKNLRKRPRPPPFKNLKEPDNEKIKEILIRTGYDLEVTAGQRKYGGPPPDMTNGTPPGQGHEVFCGKLPRDVYEDELVPIFEQFGKIWDLRIMMDPFMKCGRGYCFITFCDKSAAEEAVKSLDYHELRPNKRIRVNASIANLRLFVGNIPKTKSKEEIQKEFEKYVDGLTQVIVYMNSEDRKKNRGFAFLQFDTHKNASAARRKLNNGKIRVWNTDIMVDWADPQEEPDETVMATVKVLYVRNIPSTVNEETLKCTFESHGAVDRVKKVKDYAFIHFTERDDALKACEELNGTMLEDSKLEISLAKPMKNNRKKDQRRREQERRYLYMMGRYSGYDDFYNPYYNPWLMPPYRSWPRGRQFNPQNRKNFPWWIFQ